MAVLVVGCGETKAKQQLETNKQLLLDLQLLDTDRSKPSILKGVASLVTFIQISSCSKILLSILVPEMEGRQR